MFIGADTGLNPNRQQIYHQSIRRTRAYFEMDPMTPAALGRELWSLVPLSPDGEKTLLCDAGSGLIGSPSVSYDGKTVYFTMAKAGEAYFHIYKIDTRRSINKSGFVKVFLIGATAYHRLNTKNLTGLPRCLCSFSILHHL